MLSQKFTAEAVTVQSHQNNNSKVFIKEAPNSHTATDSILTRPNGMSKIIGSLILL